MNQIQTQIPVQANLFAEPSEILKRATVTLYDLKVERRDEQTIRIYQGPSGDDDVIDLHPSHVRLLAEAVGLLPVPDPDAQACQARVPILESRLQMLHDRIDYLADFIRNYSDHAHADLSHEMVLVNALLDVSEVCCADFRSGLRAETEGA